MDGYRTVPRAGEAEFTGKRSRFIGHIAPVRTEDEAAAFLADIRARHKKANHNCYAYILREGNIMRYSDDGEPHGTAGTPILEVIRREGIVDVGVVVTRYFGGILLGAGGLVRAYANAAKLALDAVGIAQMCLCSELVLEMPYARYERVLKLLDDYPARVLDTSFAGDVTLYIRIRSDGLAALEAVLTEHSAGILRPIVIGEMFAAM
ncbi:MAG: YigZ family protein [Oscillospiraceae bacterium]|nr:YigZ family protein [Oscillospiraceae bacterium]